MSVQVAFYNGRGNVYDWLIRFWTRSRFSHVELIVDGIWYTASPRDGGVITRIIEPNPEHWEIYELDADYKELALEVFHQQALKGYDWVGIFFSQFLPWGFHLMDRWFCSELVATMLGFENGQAYSPQTLFKTLQKQARFKRVFLMSK